MRLRLFLLGLCSLGAAQSTTSSSIPATTTATRTTSQTLNSTTSLPANATITLSANGTATATIANGTVIHSSTPTSSAAYPSLTGVSSCVVGCITVSVGQSNCSAITDEKCFCSSPTFRNATVQCVSTQCPSELASAESLAQQFCNMVSVTLTFPSSTLPGTTSASASGTPRSGNGAISMGYLPALAAWSSITVFTIIGFGLW